MGPALMMRLIWKPGIPPFQLPGQLRRRFGATETLDVDIDGAGNVRYYGSPHVTQDIDGISSVRGLGEH